ncbi:MAG: DUF2791 family P-loop domain-containing protein [Chloroflexi bacterium]|nr:DUF2791 family P-loop domain-containing protein [Chloroflexota bacterium]
MCTTPEEWLRTIRTEYLSAFIRNGGAAVKFVVPLEDIPSNELSNMLRQASEQEGYLFTTVDAASTKVHMIDKLFHRIAAQIDWDDLSRDFIKELLTQEGLRLPPAGGGMDLQSLAELNRREQRFLRNDIKEWLEGRIFHDFEMSQEFRIAMMRLCQDQLEPAGPSAFLSDTVKEWLRGELRLISALKEALIFQKIVRYNARHMLFSLAHWIRMNGRSGLVVALDISRYLVSTRSHDPEEGFFYSIPALLDVYEVLRQFVDGTDEMEGCLIVVLAPPDFLYDERRGLNRYDALKMRIYDEVRDRRRQNPLASLIRLGTRDQ